MRSFLVVALLSACSKSPTPQKQAGSAAPVVVAPADATVAAKKKVAATPAQVAEYRKHMKAGWAAQKAKKWADATAEFEAATKILEGDQRALSEFYERIITAAMRDRRIRAAIKRAGTTLVGYRLSA